MRQFVLFFTIKLSETKYINWFTECHYQVDCQDVDHAAGVIGIGSVNPVAVVTVTNTGTVYISNLVIIQMKHCSEQILIARLAPTVHVHMLEHG